MTPPAVERAKRVVIVEDEPEYMAQFVRLLRPYGDAVEVAKAGDAGEALSALVPPAPAADATILDLMLPYGSARAVLGEGDESERDTGVLLLEHLAKHGDGVGGWIAVVTGRCGIDIMPRIEGLLRRRGRLYLRPYDGIQLEHDLATAIGLESLVPRELLPPPLDIDGGEGEGG